MQRIVRRFNSLQEVVDAIDISIARADPSIVSTKAGLRHFFQQYRQKPECSKNMKHALNKAINSMKEEEPECLEDCVGLPGFGNDPEKPVLRLARQFFEGALDLDLAAEHSVAVEHASSNRSKCVKCKKNIVAGALRTKKKDAAAIVTNQGGRPMMDYMHLTCFFERHGERNFNTSGLDRVEDLVGFDTLSSAEQRQVMQLWQDSCRRFQERRSKAQPRPSLQGRRAAGKPPEPLPGRSRPERGRIVQGDREAMLKMCGLEQYDESLRKAIQDVLPDASRDFHLRPSERLDFEVVLSTSGQPSSGVFLIERKSFHDLYASQRAGGTGESRLASQLQRLVESEFQARFLIVEVPDSAWRDDATPGLEYQDCLGVQTFLRLLQQDGRHAEMEDGHPRLRVLRVRSQEETAKALQQLMKEAVERPWPPADGPSPKRRRAQVPSQEGPTSPWQLRPMDSLGPFELD